ncbi:MAG: hypothetical protein IJ344_07145 [Clostridia bacterium]|nr:hypothetical protein [Clostridia bacterium]
MKKLTVFLLAALLLLPSCSTGTTTDAPQTDESESYGESYYIDGFYESESEEEESDFLDLAKLDAAEQYNKAVEIQVYFREFEGKTVRFAGQYYLHENGYHYLTVADNANCCYTDFEIITRDGTYPEDKSWVIIEGVFGYYEQDGKRYPHIDVYKVEPWL